MSAIDDILRKRGREPRRENDGAYAGFLESGGHPQMGFALRRASGATDGFFYHNLDNIDLRVIRGVEYLSFTHRGKAGTLQGVRLDAIFQALMAHTLTHIIELDDRDAPQADDAIIVTRVAVSVVTMGQDAMSAATDQAVEEMRQH